LFLLLHDAQKTAKYYVDLAKIACATISALRQKPSLHGKRLVPESGHTAR
jgi:hypothetical protein